MRSPGTRSAASGYRPVSVNPSPRQEEDDEFNPSKRRLTGRLGEALGSSAMIAGTTARRISFLNDGYLGNVATLVPAAIWRVWPDVRQKPLQDGRVSGEVRFSR